jgi:hypothetical protein
LLQAGKPDAGPSTASPAADNSDDIEDAFAGMVLQTSVEMKLPTLIYEWTVSSRCQMLSVDVLLLSGVHRVAAEFSSPTQLKVTLFLPRTFMYGETVAKGTVNVHHAKVVARSKLIDKIRGKKGIDYVSVEFTITLPFAVKQRLPASKTVFFYPHDHEEFALKGHKLSILELDLVGAEEPDELFDDKTFAVVEVASPFAKKTAGQKRGGDGNDTGNDDMNDDGL